MHRFILLLKEQPTVIVGLLQAVLGILIGAGIIGFSEGQTGAILGTFSAALGLVVALAVRPFQWSFVTGLVQGAVLLAIEFGASLTEQVTGNIYTLTSLVGIIVMYFLSTPEVKLEPATSATVTETPPKVDPPPSHGLTQGY